MSRRKPPRGSGRPILIEGPKTDNQARDIARAAAHKIEVHEKGCVEAYKNFDNRVRELTDLVGEVQLTLKAVKEAVVGDELSDRPGLVKRVRRIEESIVGTPDSPGLTARLINVESDLRGTDMNPGVLYRLGEIEKTRDRLFRYALLIAALAALGGGAGANSVQLIKAFGKLIIGG